MTELEWPYSLPIWQTSLRLESPDGSRWAEIRDTVEVSMGNPTIGDLVLSSGRVISRCNPSFIWSDDSRYLAVPRYTKGWLRRAGKQQLLVIDVIEDQTWSSPKLAWYILPKSFEGGVVTVTLDPAGKAKSASCRIADIRPGFARMP